ncbi:MAG: serine hydrolase domain-containing protein [Bacteroidota bacterium]
MSLKKKYSKLIVILTGIFISMSLFESLSGHGEHHDLIIETSDKLMTDPVLSGTISRYDSLLKREFAASNATGAAVTIVHNGSIIYKETFGVTRVGTTDSVNENTVFRLASVSKGFAGILACLLQKDGYINLDEKVSTYLPGFTLKDTANTFNLTIKNTLSHTTGLVPHAYDNLIEANQSLGIMLPRLKEVDISASPGQLYGYQNLIFSLIDTITEMRTGKSYGYLLEKKIFTPLQMRNASTGYDIFEQPDANVAFPHVLARNGYISISPSKTYYNVLPAAGVNLSINDMGKWLLALLGYYPGIIDTSTIRAITTPVVQTPLKYTYTRHWHGIEDKFYSLGWRIYMYKGRKIIYHGGYVRGYKAEIAFCPEEHMGIAYLQNCSNGLASKSIPSFFSMLFENKGKTNAGKVMAMKEDKSPF